MALIPFDKLPSIVTEIDTLLKDAVLAKEVNRVGRCYYTIDITKTLGQLLQTGDLLQVAYAAGKGYKTGVAVIGILSDYQGFTVECVETTKDFVRNSFVAIENYKSAYNLAKNDKLTLALKYILKCGDMAGEMATLSGVLETRSNQLFKGASDALKISVEDSTVAEEQRREVLKLIHENAAAKAEYEAKKTDLTADVDAARQRESDAARRAEDALKAQFTIGIIQAVTGPLTSLATTYFQNTATGMSMQVINNTVNAATGRPNPPVPGIPVAGTMPSTPDAATSSTPDVSIPSVEPPAVPEHGSDKGNEKAATDKGNEKAATDKGNEKAATEKGNEKAAALAKVAGEEVNKGLDNLKKDLDKAATGAQSELTVFAKQRQELEKELREANALLQKAVVMLQGLAEEKNDLEAAIKSLETATITLGKVTVVFANCKLFWNGVKKQCLYLQKSVGDAKELAEIGESAMFLEILQQQAIVWLSLADINDRAHKQMENVYASMGDFMSNLPKDQAAARALVAKVSGPLIKDLRSETELLPGN